MKFRFCISVLLTACMLLLLCACNGGQPSDPASDDTTTTTTPSETDPNGDQTTTSGQDTTASAEENYLCELDGYAVRMGADASVAIPALGEYSDVKEAPNCLYDGYDKCYSYDGFKVTTSPNGKGGEIVTALEITSDVVSFQSSGVTIGSTADEVTAAFGTAAESAFGVWKYNLPNASMSVVLDGDTVTSISIAYTGK